MKRPASIPMTLVTTGIAVTHAALVLAAKALHVATKPPSKKKRKKRG